MRLAEVVPLVVSILGMAIAGAVAVWMIPALFGGTVPDHVVPTLAGAAGAFAVSTVSAFVLRRRMRVVE